jgi:chromosome segregation ATPase
MTGTIEKEIEDFEQRVEVILYRKGVDEEDRRDFHTLLASLEKKLLTDRQSLEDERNDLVKALKGIERFRKINLERAEKAEAEIETLKKNLFHGKGMKGYFARKKDVALLNSKCHELRKELFESKKRIKELQDLVEQRNSEHVKKVRELEAEIEQLNDIVKRTDKQPVKQSALTPADARGIKEDLRKKLLNAGSISRDYYEKGGDGRGGGKIGATCEHFTIWKAEFDRVFREFDFFAKKGVDVGGGKK